METLVVQVDTAARAGALLKYFKTLIGVKSVTHELLPLKGSDWVKPGRPATEEEMVQMLNECESEYKSGNVLSVNEARSLTTKKLAEWKKKNPK